MAETAAGHAVQTDRMVDLALSMAAAPTYFPASRASAVSLTAEFWANHATMLAEALTCFDLGRDQIDVLSLRSGDDSFVVSRAQIYAGGFH